MIRSFAALCGLLTLTGPGQAVAAGIRGDYVEARSNDVFTGPCFSNAEVFLTGHQGLMVWKVSEGSYRGVDLAGLSVAAAVRGTSTFDADEASRAKSVILVDKDATPAQREALVALAKELGGDRLRNVVEVKSSALTLTVEHATAEPASAGHSTHDMPRAPHSAFFAPGLAEIRTRPLDAGDHRCGNEVLAFSPLSRGVDVLPAYTLNNSFRGQGLDTRWDDPHARSSLVGRFSL